MKKGNFGKTAKKEAKRTDFAGSAGSGAGSVNATTRQANPLYYLSFLLLRVVRVVTHYSTCEKKYFAKIKKQIKIFLYVIVDTHYPHYPQVFNFSIISGGYLTGSVKSTTRKLPATTRKNPKTATKPNSCKIFNYPHKQD